MIKIIKEIEILLKQKQKEIDLLKQRQINKNDLKKEGKE